MLIFQSTVILYGHVITGNVIICSLNQVNSCKVAGNVYLSFTCADMFILVQFFVNFDDPCKS